MAKTRRNKNRGGSRKNRNNTGSSNNTAVSGGKRKRASTRKLSKGASNWQQAVIKGASTWQKSVMKVYKEMKAKNPNVKLGEAMKKAAELKRKGQL